ncbi:KOW domain-containing RNA-binding protein [Paenibacillus pinihumi]|uniref:KOW domain-containing RNA-binding protein n=1 Tax=Paenibacillus pinihumi TaxID=669462 RepID=UPI00040A3271|nr:KOW domain-containing RNA-binding protein [Paenibacillus pinihumi]
MRTMPQIGQIVKVLRGKDEGSFAVVVGLSENEPYVWIADGNKRRFDQRKRKNILHLELQPETSSEVADSMHETGRVTNGKLRYVIQKFIERKGE